MNLEVHGEIISPLQSYFEWDWTRPVCCVLPCSRISSSLQPLYVTFFIQEGNLILTDLFSVKLIAIRNLAALCF